MPTRRMMVLAGVTALGVYAGIGAAKIGAQRRLAAGSDGPVRRALDEALVAI